MLIRRLLLVALLLAIAFAAVATWVVERVRAGERVTTVERIAAAANTDLNRARCEANPMWFLAGPRENAPSAALMAHPDADVLAPRPDTDPRPVEFFAYDIELVGQSTAAPRLSNTMRARLRMTEQLVTERFETPDGVGAQTVMATRWDGPCAFLLFRLHPPPNQFRQQASLFGVYTLGAFVVTMLVAWPVERRIRRLGGQMRASARTEYREPASVGGRDELSQLGFAFNEAGIDLNRLQTDLRDRDADLRRFISYLGDDSESLLQSVLAAPDPVGAVNDALQVSNVVVGSHLRDPIARQGQPVDVSGVVTTVAREFEHFAAARKVALVIDRLDSGIVVSGESMFLAQALRNILAFSIDRGGRVSVTLVKTDDGFSLRVTDTGANLPDEELRKLNAVRRFRGDEGRGAGLRGDIGLGMAIVHEVCHRFELHLSFERPVTGGLQVELRKA
jgi:signal transduction histidine kinase